MTNEEAIKYLIVPIVKSTDIGKEKQKEIDAYNMAIKALSQEEKTGYWIEHEIEDVIRYLECSNCHYETYNVKHNYCMNCGARMIEPRESEDKE